MPDSSDVARIKLPPGEEEFRQFLKNQLNELLSEMELPKPSEEERELARRVPFSQHEARAVASALACDPEPQARSAFWSLISEGLEVAAWITSNIAAVKLLSAWTHRAFSTAPVDETTSSSHPARSDIESLNIQALLDHQRETDEQLGHSMDEQERELGPAPFPRPPTDL